MAAYEIPLRRRDGSVRAVVLVDAEDYERFGQYSWSLSGSGYANRGGEQKGERWCVYLHREILGLESGDGCEVDHVNQDKLDCRRANMRVVDRKANQQNIRSLRGSTSKHRGVYWWKLRGKWVARAQLNGRGYWLGNYDNEEEAARVVSEWRAQHMPYSSDARGTVAA